MSFEHNKEKIAQELNYQFNKWIKEQYNDLRLKDIVVYLPRTRKQVRTILFVLTLLACFPATVTIMTLYNINTTWRFDYFCISFMLSVSGLIASIPPFSVFSIEKKCLWSYGCPNMDITSLIINGVKIKDIQKQVDKAIKKTRQELDKQEQKNIIEAFKLKAALNELQSNTINSQIEQKKQELQKLSVAANAVKEELSSIGVIDFELPGKDLSPVNKIAQKLRILK